MKTILSTLFLVGFLLQLKADDALQNGDFSDQLTHWSGDIEDMSQVDPGSNTKGMVIKLDPDEWKKAIQEFTPQGSNYTLTITYKVSDDFHLTDDKKAYRGVPAKLGFNLWKGFRIPDQDWMVMFWESQSGNAGVYFPVSLVEYTSGTATFQTNILNMTPKTDQSIMLAFPPGHGSVTILNVSMTDTTQPVIADTPDFTLTGEGVTMQKLNNDAKAYANRNYIWKDVPLNIVGQSYTQGLMNTRLSLTVHAKKDFRVQVITAADLPDWDKIGTPFSYTDERNTPMFIYQKLVLAGQDLVIPEGLIAGPDLTTGVYVLVPN